MNSSIEQARKQQEVDLNIGFIQYNYIETNNKQHESLIENYYLSESSDLDDSLLEHFKTAQSGSFEQTKYLSLESYESGIYHVASPISSSKPISKK